MLVDHVGGVLIYNGDCRDTLKQLAMDGVRVQTCVTSPPYYGLRDYGVDGQLGLEQTPDEYVANMVEVFRAVRDVLADDGTLWLNIGDSYAGSWGNQGRKSERGTQRPINGGMMQSVLDGRYPMKQSNTGKIPEGSGLKPKDLIGIPWLLAFALRADGWYLRQDIIWHKPNPMPESVRDRCTKAHEYIFLLSKGPRYYFDHEAIKEPSVTSDPRRPYTSVGAKQLDGRAEWKSGQRRDGDDFTKRNRRSVWSIPTSPFKGAHFATFPPALVEPCILSGSSQAGNCPHCGKPWVRDTRKKAETIKKSVTVGWRPSCACPERKPVPALVLDPFAGAGTTGLVAARLGRRAILCELNDEYAALARDRIEADSPLFARGSVSE
jgi:DNA modification methylase